MTPPCLLVGKPLRFSASFLQSAARIICSLLANKFHTCSLICIFRQVHALTEKFSDFIFFLRRKLCEAFCTDWQGVPYISYIRGVKLHA